MKLDTKSSVTRKYLKYVPNACQSHNNNAIHTTIKHIQKSIRTLLTVCIYIQPIAFTKSARLQTLHCTTFISALWSAHSEIFEKADTNHERENKRML
jgi:hypothetical protein